MQQELVVQPGSRVPAVGIPMELTVTELRRRHDLIQEAIRELFVEEHHFGQIPGTDKKSLYKAGAEKLCSLFMLAASFNQKTKDLPEGHREYVADCTLTHVSTGIVWGMGSGSCSTLESKYRWRLGSRKCPECHSEAIRKSKNEPGFYCWNKIGGCGAKFPEGDKRIISQELGRVPNPDIADQYNTCLKMAMKRALVGAVLLVTAASDALIPEEDEDDEDDEDDDKRRGKGAQRKAEPQQQRREDPPPKGEPAPGEKIKLELANDCAKMASDLGLEAGPLKEWLKQNGVPAFDKWRDLDEPTLLKVRTMLQKQLKAGQAPTDGGQS